MDFEYYDNDGYHPTLYRTVTRSTVSSTATADDLPGPGRNVGNLFRAWGGKFEDVLADLNAYRIRRGNDPTMGVPGTSASAMVTIPLHRTASISTISTNATADNLPGPGRNVGLLFGWIGGHLEVRLGRVMSHRGYGPDAVANTLARIRRHHVGLLADFYSSAAEPSKGFEPRSKAERRKVKKLCKTLLKYTTSHVETTQIAACNRITDLAIYDPYIRHLLCSFLSSSKADLAGLSLDLMSDRSPEGYLQDDYDPLLSSSRTALISVTETRVHELWAERSAEWLYSVTSFHALKSSQEEYERAFKSFEHFLDHGMVSLLQDPDVSFICMRRLLQELKKIMHLESAYLLIELQFAGTMGENLSHIVDWDTLDQIWSTLCVIRLRENADPVRNALTMISDLGAPFIEKAGLLPSTMEHFLEIQSLPLLQPLVDGDLHAVFPADPKEVQFYNEQSGKSIYKMAYLVFKILSKCTDSEYLAHHLVFIDSLDEQRTKALSPTIFLNKSAIALCHLLLLYCDSTPTISRGGFQYFYHDEYPDLLKSVLESCLESQDPGLSRIGQDIVQILGKYDRYWKLQLSSWFPEFHPKCHWQYPSNPTLVFQRHFTTDGIHCVTIKSDLTQTSNIAWSTCSQQNVEADIELLHCDGDLIWIPSSSGPFAPDGHFPILAGYTSQGQETYLACTVYSPDAPGQNSYFYTATVTEGEEFARFWYEGSPWAHPSYYVLALRHDPSDILPGTIDAPRCDVQDRTGPLYWTTHQT